MVRDAGHLQPVGRYRNFAAFAGLQSHHFIRSKTSNESGWAHKVSRVLYQRRGLISEHASCWDRCVLLDT